MQAYKSLITKNPKFRSLALFLVPSCSLWFTSSGRARENPTKKSANPSPPARIKQKPEVDIEWKGFLMRSGNYEASDSGRTAGTALTFLLIGLGAGALLGMLIAPKAGKQMRKELRRKIDSARETVDEWTDDAREFAEGAMERGADIADQVKDRVAPLRRAMRR
jgi:gas vesicle protein